MLPFYKPELIDSSGVTIREIYDAISVQAARAFNADGSCTVVIPSYYPRSWFRMHLRMVLWRHDYEGVPRNFGETIWFLKKIDHDRSNLTYTLTFVDAFAMLKGRLIAYTSQGPYADKTLEEFELVTYNSALRADNMMRAYMRENVGAEALDTTRLIPDIVIEEDRDLGAYVEKQAAWAELEATLVDITRMSSAKGVDLFYDLLPQTQGKFAFHIWSDLRGVDRVRGTDQPLVLTEESGLISDVHEVEDWTDVATYVYVLGFDSGGSQIIVRAENKALSRDDPFGRIEITANASEADANSVLSDMAVGTLRSHRPRKILTAKVVENSSLVFGRDFDYGDRLMVQVGAAEYECVLDAVATNWQQGREELDLRLQGTVFTDEFEVTVWAPPEPAPTNEPPTADAGPDQTIDFGMAAIMDGSSSDDGLPNPPATLTNTWSQTSGAGTALFGDIHNLGTTTTFDAPGVYVIRLTASDGDLSTFDEMTVTVNDTEEPPPDNLPPTVDAGPDQVIDFGMAAIMAGDTDDDGLPNPPGTLDKTWTQESGPGTALFGDIHSSGTTVTFDAPGVYVLRFTADDSALTAFDECTITVNEV